ERLPYKQDVSSSILLSPTSRKKPVIRVTGFFVVPLSFVVCRRFSQMQNGLSTGFTRAADYGSPYTDCGLRTATVSMNDERPTTNDMII
ncbi:MAG: hypothetical protein ACI4NR_08620, partial [Megasphaera sp.]|uniref:hypothetical protein n=1 Tax=Megasphaera sp. TaxID=2023260 RepID=UPI003EFDA462